MKQPTRPIFLTILLLFAAALTLAACRTSVPLPAPTFTALPPSVDLYFTHACTPAQQPDAPAPLDALVQAVNAAQEQVDMAIYNLSYPPLVDALIAAHERGVLVRLVVENENRSRSGPAALQDAGISVRADSPDGLMHNKFAVIDAADVWTGSMNFTANSNDEDANHLIHFHSTQLAQIFTAEFEEMFTQNRFGANSPRGDEMQGFIFDGVQVEVLFAPDDQPEERVIELIGSARQSVEMLAYSFTSDPIGNALLSKARDGVRVRVVQDAEQVTGTGSEYKYLSDSGLDIRLDACDGLMHHKVIILDGNTVVIGSYNFTKSANTRNDETLLVIRAPHLAAAFQQEFEALYAAAVTH
ncbi:hypothetical protein ADN00_01985 [Ornatilinea apprima]|uniref:phospholipase D n=1 Tax=Ornatilinea apprima TaxID=1134406 RepID=A0A0P6Y4M6_9CHLR|nr:phospholipase D-like domain-containing protein [Ornatilinea apprima]KPL80065.1 hypothetical protein ADN00_01985 [Ornatilinea apprima]